MKTVRIERKDSKMQFLSCVFKLIMQSKFASYRNNFVIDFRYSSYVYIMFCVYIEPSVGNRSGD